MAKKLTKFQERNKQYKLRHKVSAFCKGFIKNRPPLVEVAVVGLKRGGLSEDLQKKYLRRIERSADADQVHELMMTKKMGEVQETQHAALAKRFNETSLGMTNYKALLAHPSIVCALSLVIGKVFGNAYLTGSVAFVISFCLLLGFDAYKNIKRSSASRKAKNILATGKVPENAQMEYVDKIRGAECAYPLLEKGKLSEEAQAALARHVTRRQAKDLLENDGVTSKVAVSRLKKKIDFAPT